MSFLCKISSFSLYDLPSPVHTRASTALVLAYTVQARNVVEGVVAGSARAAHLSRRGAHAAALHASLLLTLHASATAHDVLTAHAASHGRCAHGALACDPSQAATHRATTHASSHGVHRAVGALTATHNVRYRSWLQRLEAKEICTGRTLCIKSECT